MSNEKTNSVSRKPHFRGINSATDIPKAFRSHGNHLLMSYAIERKHGGGANKYAYGFVPSAE